MLKDRIELIVLKRLLYITAAFFVSVQCSDTEDTGAYTVANGVTHRYFRKAADSVPLVKHGDVLVLNLEYKTISDSLLFSSSEVPGVFRVQVERPETGLLTVDSVLSLVRPGDSLSFFLDAQIFYQYNKRVPLPDFLVPGDSLLFTAGIVAIERQEVLESEHEQLQARLQFQEDELVKEYAAEHLSGVEPLPSGLYVKMFKNGSGALPQPGEIVHIDYTMSYLNGEVFYSTLKKKQPFSFTMGDGSVIPGLEAGVARLSKGSHALLLIPSHLAYGAEGYKIIRPYTPLLFEVKVLQD